MQTRLWMLTVVAFGLLLTTCAKRALAAQPQEPHPFGLTLGSSHSPEVLAAIEQIHGARIQVFHPPLAKGNVSAAERALESNYEGMTNPRETRVAADSLNFGNLTCKRAEFSLLDDTLYGVACRATLRDLHRFATLRNDLIGKYGRPTEGINSKNAKLIEWHIAGKKVLVERDVLSGIIVSFVDTALAARAEAVRLELLANPILLMEEMRKSSQSDAIGRDK